MTPSDEKAPESAEETKPAELIKLAEPAPLVTPEVTQTTIEDAVETPKVIVMDRKRKINLNRVKAEQPEPAPEVKLDPAVEYPPNSSAATTIAEMNAGRVALAKHRAELERNQKLAEQNA